MNREDERWHDGGARSSRADDRERTAEDVLDLASWERYRAAVDAHGARLYRLAVLLCGDHGHAEDLVHQLFLAAHAPWRDGRVDDLGAYLRRSLTNRVLTEERHHSMGSRFRDRRRGNDAAGLDDGGEVGPPSLLAALDELEGGPRAAVVLRYYEGMSPSDTASLLGVSERTVTQHVSHALHLLLPAIEVRH